MNENSFSTAPPIEEEATMLSHLKQRIIGTGSSLLLPVMQRLARDYIGGETIEDAMSVGRRLALENRSHTLGFWDTPDYTGRQVADIYLDAIESLAASGLDGYLSIKLPALRFDTALTTELAIAAQARGVRLHCDSHGVDAADPSHDIMQRMLGKLSANYLSTTLPGRWSRSRADADWAVERGLAVRVVKGQWPDPEDPRRDMRAGFLDVIDHLAGRACHVAVATHDVPLIAEASARLRAVGTCHDLELIHGMPIAGPLRWADQNRVSVRVYIPCGKGFIPNAIRQLRRNPRLLWRIMGRAIGWKG